MHHTQRKPEMFAVFWTGTRWLNELGSFGLKTLGDFPNLRSPRRSAALAGVQNAENAEMPILTVFAEMAMKSSI